MRDYESRHRRRVAILEAAQQCIDGIRRRFWCGVDIGANLPRRVIGIAASAGGVEALRHVIAGLPADLDAAVCVVLHIPSTGRSLLAPILDRAGPLRAVLARRRRAAAARASIYVAPADHHLLVGAETLTLAHGPKENGVRPAADPLFRSLAESPGARRAVAVVLSGALDDGAAGAVRSPRAGGRVFVQDPGDAFVAEHAAERARRHQPDAVLARRRRSPPRCAGSTRRCLEGAG